MVKTKKETKEKKATQKKKPVQKKKSPEKEKVETKKPALKESKKAKTYYEGIGRRKTSVARVRISLSGDKKILVNEKDLNNYFTTLELQQIVISPFEKMNYLNKFSVSAKAKGGGIHSQAEATRHGISKALIIFNPEFRKKLKKAGFLTRDPRMRERKKFGLRRARRAPQWQKR